MAINSDAYHTMVAEDGKLGFAASTSDLPDPIPVKSIERISSTELIVIPVQTGWNYRIKRSQDFVDVYDIRIEDHKEFFRARFKRI